MDFSSLNNLFKNLYNECKDADIAFKNLSLEYDLSDFCYKMHPHISWSVQIDSSNPIVLQDDFLILSSAFERAINSITDFLNIVDTIVSDYICSGIDPFNAFHLFRESFELSSIRFNLLSNELSPTLCTYDDYYNNPFNNSFCII